MNQAIGILKKELALDKRALKKSIETNQVNNPDLLKLHKSNLEPRIKDLSEAINLLVENLN